VSELQDLLAAMVGTSAPGGCDDCDAVQTLERDPRMPGIYLLHVQHDETCPTYQRLKRNGVAR
jgi:hypothetical protein